MKIKIQVGEAGTYVGVIYPPSGEHKKSIVVPVGHAVEIALPDVHDANGVKLGLVVDAEDGPPRTPEAVDEEQPDEEPQKTPPEDRDPTVGLAIGRVVTYRSRTGDYDLPAIVTATTETLNPKGVEAGHIPSLTDATSVHLTCFTAGKPGEGADELKVSSKNVAGCYQEWDIPLAGSVRGSTRSMEPRPGTWRWPERK